jgi:hypothetical protein
MTAQGKTRLGCFLRGFCGRHVSCSRDGMQRIVFSSVVCALILAACGGAMTSGSGDADGGAGSGNSRGGISSGAVPPPRGEPVTAPGTASATPTWPSKTPCEYDAPPPPNSPACPKTWLQACHSSTPFVCPDTKLECWYANVGDETSPGCYAHGLMRCSEWPVGDGGTRVEARCAQ